MTPHFELRSATVGDNELLLDVLAEAGSWMHDELGVTNQWPRRFPDELFVSALEQGLVHFVVIDDEVVGTIRLMLDDPEVWPDVADHRATYVHGFAIRRAHAGAGLGAHVLDEVQRRSARSGRPVLRLDCIASNPGIRRYYERLGFESRGEIEQNFAFGSWRAARYERCRLQN